LQHLDGRDQRGGGEIFERPALGDAHGLYIETLGAWFKKCYFRVTPDPAKAAPAKGFHVLSVTLL
jgi:hypothetical protein